MTTFWLNMGTDYHQTRGIDCNQILGQHWFYEEYSMFFSERDDSGGWGTLISSIGNICPFCEGKLVGESIKREDYHKGPRITSKDIS